MSTKDKDGDGFAKIKMEQKITYTSPPRCHIYPCHFFKNLSSSPQYLILVSSSPQSLISLSTYLLWVLDDDNVSDDKDILVESIRMEANNTLKKYLIRINKKLFVYFREQNEKKYIY